MKKYSICLVGATGLVGSTFLKILGNSNFPLSEIYLYASSKSQGKIIKFRNSYLKVNKLDKNYKSDCNFTVFMTNKDISIKYAKLALKNNSIVIDNSSAFRKEKNVPLIVPPINKGLLKDKHLISNPNCVTAICALPLKIIDDNFKIKTINITSLQSVSGSGINGINELKNTLKGMENKFYKSNITKTCIPEIGEIKDNLFSEEENKIIDEIRKITDDYEIEITATSIRVPIERCHLISVYLTTLKNFNLAEVKVLFKNRNGLKLIDEIDNSSYPDQILPIENGDVYVGRLRKIANKNALLFVVSGDNLYRGSALNAFEIMESYIKINDNF